MNRLLLRVLPVAACFALQVHAQITITQADVDAALSTGGTTTRFATTSSAGLTALAAQTGTNQTWDFTGLTYADGEAGTVTPVQPPVPGSDNPHLAQATHILRVVSSDSTAYIYERLEAGSETALGVANDEFQLREVPGRTILALPATFGTSWTSSYETETDPPFPPGVTFSTDETSEVVGWGTLVTPAGSTDALMIHTETTTTLTFTGFPPIVTVSDHVQYTAYGLINANIFLPSSGPASGDYTVYVTGTAVEPPAETARTAQLDAIAPNPLRLGDAMQVTYTLPAPVAIRLDVLDALGRHVATVLDGAMQAAGRHETVWPTADLAPGVYLVRLTAGTETVSQRLTVTR